MLLVDLWNVLAQNFIKIVFVFLISLGGICAFILSFSILISPRGVYLSFLFSLFPISKPHLHWNRSKSYIIFVMLKFLLIGMRVWKLFCPETKCYPFVFGSFGLVCYKVPFSRKLQLSHLTTRHMNYCFCFVMSLFTSILLLLCAYHLFWNHKLPYGVLALVVGVVIWVSQWTLYNFTFLSVYRKLMRRQSTMFFSRCWITTSNGADICVHDLYGIGHLCNLMLSWKLSYFCLLSLLLFSLFLLSTYLNFNIFSALKLLIGTGNFFWFHYTFSYGVKLLISVFSLNAFAIYFTM